MLGRDLKDRFEGTQKSRIIFITAGRGSLGDRSTIADQFGGFEDTASCNVLMKGLAGLRLEGAHEMIAAGIKKRGQALYRKILAQMFVDKSTDGTGLVIGDRGERSAAFLQK